jgi:PAS domain S-box-containing protein
MPKTDTAEEGRESRSSDPSSPELSEVHGFLDRARKTEEAWRLLMESVKDFAIILVGMSGRIVSWNTGAARLLGYKDTEIIGESLSRLFIPEDISRDIVESGLRTAARDGRSGDDNWLLRKDGSRFWANGITTPLRDRDGKLVGYAKVVRDLTERKLAEESLRKANESLEERVAVRTRELQLRIRELEGFASSVAHDLRAPLRAIHRYAELVLGEYRNRPLDPEGEESVERIVESAERMDELIGHLLSYSRLDGARLDLRPVNLQALAGQAIQELSLEIKDRNASVEVVEPLPGVLGDSGMLLQILSNLLSNAIKYVPAGITPNVRVRGETRNGNARVWVEDNGIGIAPEHQDRIFLPFERLHGNEEYPGTGIGLAIVKKSAERMGGSVGVESKLGRGARFWVDLPRVES